MAVATFTKSGAKAATPAKLNKAIFGLEVKNHQFLKDAYLSYLSSNRQGRAKAKTRGEVRGSTAKPWRQKGTGNARFGSRYNPIWRGGGVAFGPTGIENHQRKLSAKARQQALKQALSLAASEDRIRIIETFACPEGRVKPTIQLLQKIGAGRSSLIVVSVKDTLVERATRNLPGVKAVQASNLAAKDVLDANNVVISKKSLEILDGRLGPSTNAQAKTLDIARGKEGKNG